MQLSRVNLIELAFAAPMWLHLSMHQANKWAQVLAMSSSDGDQKTGVLFVCLGKLAWVNTPGTHNCAVVHPDIVYPDIARSPGSQ